MLVVPSRGRPQNLSRLLDAWEDTNATVPVFLRLDACDPQLPVYEDLFDCCPGNWTIVVGPRTKFVGACKELFERWPDAEWYGFLGDDCVPRTPGWDQMLVKAAGSRNVAWPNDITQAPKCTHPFIGGDLVRSVGWFCAPGFLHWYIDTTWEWIANHTGRAVYCADIVVEHVHYDVDKKLFDETYQERWLDPQTGKNKGHGVDDARYREWKKHEAPAIIERLNHA